ncbi:MAG: AraC family transcriptional regulator ligand-binding domain-containing protein [Myxococcota bacterium]|nr:AraC family transcriptional regulator ligand-binding domain-containing protein [Myxococcota bacterium]
MIFSLKKLIISVNDSHPSPGAPLPSPSTWITRLLERSGVDLDALRTRLPREFDLVAGRPADIPLDHGLRLVAGCEQLLGESNFGLRLAEKTDFRDMGIYGYLLLNAQTLGQFLELAAKYFGVLIRTSSIYFASGPRRSRFEYRIESPTSEPVRHDVDWSFGAYVCFARKVLGDAWRPQECSVVYPEPENSAEHRDFYGSSLIFGATANAFELDSDLLRVRINDADPELLGLIRNQADLLISGVQKNPDFLHHVRLLAIQSTKRGGCSARRLAAESGMSVSTFNRRLAKYGTNFRQIRDETIHDLAREALKHPELPIGTIALRLGYSETAAFDHAFKRLEGVSPRSYRRRLPA